MVVSCSSHVLTRSWLGYFAERATSPQQPELSALNRVLREMRCGEQLPQELSDAMFPSSRSANNAQYVDAPHTRPFNYSVYPFRLTPGTATRHQPHAHSDDCDHCVQTAALRAQLDCNNEEAYSLLVHRSFMRALRTSKAYRTAGNELVAVDGHVWVEGQFTVDCVCNGNEVVRHVHEGSWNNHTAEAWYPDHNAKGAAAEQQYMFAIPCDDRAQDMEGEGLGSGVPMACSSVYHSSLPFPLPAVFRLVQHWPPFYDTEHVAYGFVHRWILVQQGAAQTVIARVGILSSEKSKFNNNRTWLYRFPADERPELRARASSVPASARRDLFVTGQWIYQRITVAPLPLHNNKATWVVGHVR